MSKYVNKINKYIKPADIILLVALLIIGIATTVVLSINRTTGDFVVIESNGELYGTYSLSEDRQVTVHNGEETNTVVIHNGEVTVSQASCHNQVCVKHGSISATGESIVCLPNKLIVKIQGRGGDKYDAVSN